MLITDLPFEILTQILELVEGTDLAQLCKTNSTFWSAIVEQEPLWKQKCTLELGTHTFEPYKSWYDQYCVLWRHKWLRPSIWHGDKNVFGTLAASLYNKDEGAFEVYEVVLSPSRTSTNERNHVFQLVIEQRGDSSTTTPTTNENTTNGNTTNSHGTANGRDTNDQPQFYIGFSQVPIIRLGRHTDYDSEKSLTMFDSNRQLFTLLMRAAAISPDRQHRSMSLWPPKMLPAKSRARNVSGTGFRGHYNKNTMTACQDLFRVRRWVTYMHSPFNLVMGESVETFSRLLPEWYYHNDNSKGLQGIWIASLTHGLQAILVRELNDGRRVEAIKLTGDIDVPRGEYFFISDDVDAKHSVESECQVPNFVHMQNMRIIRTVYQTADMNYMNNTYSNGSLVHCNPNTLVLYHENGSYLGHMYRIDVEPLMRDRPNCI